MRSAVYSGEFQNASAASLEGHSDDAGQKAFCYAVCHVYTERITPFGGDVAVANDQPGRVAAVLDRPDGLAERFAAKHHELAEHDQSDHVGLTRLTQELRGLEGEVTATESRWLGLSEMLE